jgi:Protein of unknown function (DUF1573)
MKLKSIYSTAIVLTIAFTLAACGSESTTANGSNDSTNTGSEGVEATATASTGGIITFDTTFHDFGTIVEGAEATHIYKFKNTGTGPITIRKVQPSCGCTTPEYTQNAVQPGGEGFVKVVFNSTGKSDVQNKDVTVVTDQPAPNDVIKLRFKAVVNAAG